MTTRVDTEEISATRSEKFLAIVLMIFVLIGTSWLYVKIDDWTGVDDAWTYSAADQAAIDARDQAWDRLSVAQDDFAMAESELSTARADLALAVDRGGDAEALEDAYETARERHVVAKTELTDAQEDAARAEQAAAAVEDDRRVDTWRLWLSAGLRLGFVAGLIAGSLVLVSRLRSRESRYVPLGFALAASAVVMALVFAVDYVTDYIDILDLGPIILSLFGIAVTIAAFIALQKYLARRIPRSRVRKNECPFCGFPVHGDGPHCEGCGREVIAHCGACDQPRRVGSPFCAHCGTA